VLALWPLARTAQEPLVLRLDCPASSAPLHSLFIDSGADDPLATLEILSGELRGLSRPLPRVDAPAFLPAAVTGRAAGSATPGVLPPLSPDAPSMVDLLATPDSPAQSPAWGSIGTWNWHSWHGQPSAWQVRCTPWSSGLRVALDEYDYKGVQILRYDRRVYGDFEARVHVTLRSGAAAEPFVCQSERSTVGIAYRLQEQARPGAAWGAGSCAGVSLEADAARAAYATVLDFEALELGRNRATHAALMPVGGLTTDVEIPRAPLLAGDGFSLRLIVRGARTELYVNNAAEPALVYEDSGGALPPGRIGLFTDRLIAVFDQFEVTPLPPP
jgi:hypothetical protein